MNFSRPGWLLVACAGWAGALVAGEPQRLTHDGIHKRDPQFVDGGKALIYGYDEQDDLVRVMRLDLGSGEAQPLVKDVGDKHHIEPALSADGRYLSVTECTGNLTAKLVIRDLQEGRDVAITHSGRGGTRSPAFSPDNRRVVYAFAETGPQQLWSVAVDGSDKQQLTQCEGISNWPSFTPDGKSIVFSNSRENNYEIYVMDAGGGNERRLTENRLMDIRPEVSPDGKQVAFTSTRGGAYDVYVMDIDGGNVRQITDSEERDDYPAWHPDGKHLVVVSERAGHFDLYLYPVPDAVPGEPVARAEP